MDPATIMALIAGAAKLLGAGAEAVGAKQTAKKQATAQALRPKPTQQPAVMGGGGNITQPKVESAGSDLLMTLSSKPNAWSEIGSALGAVGDVAGVAGSAVGGLTAAGNAASVVGNAATAVKGNEAGLVGALTKNAAAQGGDNALTTALKYNASPMDAYGTGYKFPWE